MPTLFRYSRDRSMAYSPWKWSVPYSNFSAVSKSTGSSGLSPPHIWFFHPVLSGVSPARFSRLT